MVVTETGQRGCIDMSNRYSDDTSLIIDLYLHYGTNKLISDIDKYILDYD